MKKCLNIIFLLLFSFISCVTEKDPVYKSYVQPGDTFPDFSFILSDGAEVKSSQWNGKTVFLIFFSLTCQDCRDMLPVADALCREFEGVENVLFFAIGREVSSDEVRSYWTDNDMLLPVSPQDDRKIYSIFANGIVPRIYIADRNGIVRKSYIDVDKPDLERLRGDILSLL